MSPKLRVILILLISLLITVIVAAIVGAVPAMEIILLYIALLKTFELLL